MTRRALVLVVLTAFVLLVPAVALAGVKRGYYVEVKTQTYVQTNAAGTSIKYFNFPCMVNGQQQGGNIITKGMRISASGSFSYKGKSTLRSTSNSVISVSISGTYVNGRMKGKITYLTTGLGCSDRRYSAKYFGVKLEG